MKHVLALVVLLGIACATPAPAPSQFFEYLADCGSQECKVHCPELTGQVVACLLSGDVTLCLATLVAPVYGITKDVVACVVRKLGAEANANLLSGSESSENMAIANAARSWIIQQKVGYR